MLTNNRDAYRDTFFAAWDKYKRKLPLEPVENQIVSAIQLHPEYHSLLEKPSMYCRQEFALEENPFFHLSLHIAINEQIATNRPTGMKDLYQNAITQQSAHDVLHQMMGCLAEMMSIAQQRGEMPGDLEYLNLLRLKVIVE